MDINEELSAAHADLSTLKFKLSYIPSNFFVIKEETFIIKYYEHIKIGEDWPSALKALMRIVGCQK